MARERCLLDNKEIMSSTLKLREELFKDFLDNKLEMCDKCMKGIDSKTRELLHTKFMDLYNVLSDIKRTLSELKTG